MWDIGSWNASGARVQQALRSFPCRPSIVAFQELRMGDGIGIVHRSGYVVFAAEINGKDSQCPMAIRTDCMKHISVELQVNGRWAQCIDITGGDLELSITNLYLPPGGSRHWGRPPAP